MKIIVTGGSGYIGSHTVVELIEHGFSIHILDNLSNSDESILDRIEQITGIKPDFTKLDLRDKDKLSAFFAEHEDTKGIIHFAALKSVSESVENPLEYYENNVSGLTNLLKTIKSIPDINFVFSSSCTVYGSPDELPVTEDTAIGHTPTAYGYSKQISERILDDVVRSSTNLKAISLRYFNPLGAHKSKLIGELPSGVPNNLMPYITQTAIGIRKVLKVYGTDYNTPDGTAIRDYIHVEDLAKAHVKALQYLMKEKGNFHSKINIGTGIGLSVLDVIKSFEKTSGQKLNYILTDRRPGDVESIYADASKAEKLLNWKAQLTIDDMTRSSWEWEKSLRSNT